MAAGRREGAASQQGRCGRDLSQQAHMSEVSSSFCNDRGTIEEFSSPFTPGSPNAGLIISDMSFIESTIPARNPKSWRRTGRCEYVLREDRREGRCYNYRKVHTYISIMSGRFQSALSAATIWYCDAKICSRPPCPANVLATEPFMDSSRGGSYAVFTRTAPFSVRETMSQSRSRFALVTRTGTPLSLEKPNDCKT